VHHFARDRRREDGRKRKKEEGKNGLDDGTQEESRLEPREEDVIVASIARETGARRENERWDERKAPRELLSSHPQTSTKRKRKDELFIHPNIKRSQ